jgi:hypothetical protein
MIFGQSFIEAWEKADAAQQAACAELLGLTTAHISAIVQQLKSNAPA